MQIAGSGRFAGAKRTARGERTPFAIEGSAHHLEVTHHPRRVVLEDVAVVHPLAGPIVGQTGDASRAACAATFTVSSHDAERGRLAVDRDDLEEEAVQVERVVHAGLVDDVPDLQLAHLHRRVVVVRARR